MDFAWEPGQTPIDPDEASGLIPDYITTQAQLNGAEAENILAARSWLRTARGDPLSSEFLRTLHKRMFGDVWKWAGTYRTSDKNIGGPWEQVSVRVEELVRDVKVQVEHKAYPEDEIAVRFHHRLVFIHPFPNGNGRHARLAADTVLERVLGRPAFSWGILRKIVDLKAAREQYIAALKQADKGDISLLLPFARS